MNNIYNIYNIYICKTYYIYIDMLYILCMLHIIFEYIKYIYIYIHIHIIYNYTILIIYTHVYAWSPSGIHTIAALATSQSCLKPLLQRSPKLQLLLLGPRNARAMLPDASIVDSVATQRSCNAPRSCNCCFWGHAAFLQRSCTVQLLLSMPRNAPAALPDAATAASGSTQHSWNAPGRCDCCSLIMLHDHVAWSCCQSG